MTTFGASTQRSREERDAMGRAVASRLGLVWPPAKRIRRQGRPTADALWEGALRDWTRDVAVYPFEISKRPEPHPESIDSIAVDGDTIFDVPK